LEGWSYGVIKSEAFNGSSVIQYSNTPVLRVSAGRPTDKPFDYAQDKRAGGQTGKPANESTISGIHCLTTQHLDNA